MGTLGDIGCLSFNGNKIITTGGGGMIVTNEKAWVARARHLSTQAKKDSFTYDHDEIGYNHRLNNIQAAMGVAQMEMLDEYVARKRAIAARYHALLAGLPALTVLTEAPFAQSNYWLSTVRVSPEHHAALLTHLNTQGIQARPVWKLIHTLPMYQACQAYRIEHALQELSSCINLPCSVSLTDGEQSHVVQTIRAFYERH